MSELHQIAPNSIFYSLDKPHRDAIKLLFEDELSDKEIAKKVHRSKRTLAYWKKDLHFKKAQDEYVLIAVKGLYKNKAVRKLYYLMENGKSDNVKYQAAMAILKLAGMFDPERSKELEDAQIKRAQAEAVRAEAQAAVAKAQAEQLHTVANSTREKMEKLSVDDLHKIASLAGDRHDN